MESGKEARRTQDAARSNPFDRVTYQLSDVIASHAAGVMRSDPGGSHSRAFFNRDKRDKGDSAQAQSPKERLYLEFGILVRRSWSVDVSEGGWD